MTDEEEFIEILREELRKVGKIVDEVGELTAQVTHNTDVLVFSILKMTPEELREIKERVKKAQAEEEAKKSRKGFKLIK